MTSRPFHTVLVPGLACSARLYEKLMPYVWEYGAATVADTRRDHSIGGIAERLLADAPPRFALAGISMGGYVALEVMRQAGVWREFRVVPGRCGRGECLFSLRVT